MKLPKTKTENIVVQHLEKEILIYDTAINKAYCLNETSARVYEYCDGTKTFADLKRKHKYSDEFIFFALDQLRAENLLNEAAEYASPHAEISRREAARLVGFASLAALPVISVLLAPTSAHAASAFAPGSRTLRQSCNTSTDCASSAANCTNTPSSSSQRVCCVGDISRYDTGGIVNSCTGGTCSSATFVCQSDANRFCCSGSTTASCTGNSCACRCN